MQYINQLDYSHVIYHTKVKMEGVTKEDMLSNVARSGCGLCCACMAVDILIDKHLSVEESVRISEESLANHSVGTDMHVFGPAFSEKFGLSYSNTDSLDEAISHLQAGGVIIAHVGVPIGEEIGLFTKKGHYILLVSTDGKEFCILDPSYSPDKFKEPARAGRVNESHAPYLYCDVDTVHAERKIGRDVVYNLFARKR